MSRALHAPPVDYDTALVEEAVFRAVRALPPGRQAAFYRERDAAYEADEEAREERFREIHAGWFRRLGLHAPIDAALAERADRLGAIETCLVMPAASRGAEMADLLDVRDRGREGCSRSRRVKTPPDPLRVAKVGRVLALRLRSETLVESDALVRFLRHELMHVTDMLDPAFGYERALPEVAGGVALGQMLRDRYRVVWDTTIDGRLWHAGALGPEAREARRFEFVAAYKMLGVEADREFARWFDEPAPTHQAIVAFILSPRRADLNPQAWRSGQCPVCEFPVASLDPRPDRLSARARRTIQTARPAWRVEDGLCAQCADLYEARDAG